MRARRKPTVLLIEDSRLQARLVRALIAGELEMEWADRLSAGLRRIAEGGIDAVLLDLTLPDSWGMDTLRRLRAAHPVIPVVVLSGGADAELAAAAAREGAAGTIGKDALDAGVLARQVREALRGGRGGS